MDNVIKAYFYSGNIARTNTVFQYNRGMILKFMDVDLPATYRVDFANSLTGQSKTCVGTADGVIVPLEMMAKGCTVYAWAVIANEDSTVTEYQAMIPISPRAEPTDEAPNPEQQQVIDQLIAAMNQAVEQTGADVESADAAAAAAAASAQAAAASEAAASASEQATAASETAAAGSASSASDDATTAASAASTATQQAGIATSGAGTATQKAADAAASAQAAAASEQAAAGSASSASADAATASSAASTATQQAGIATSGAETATQKAADAAASAQDAASSETAAAGSAAAAATSETNAGAAETAAQTAQAAAEAAAQSVSESAAQIEENKEDIADLKSAFNTFSDNVEDYLYSELSDDTFVFTGTSDFNLLDSTLYAGKRYIVKIKFQNITNDNLTKITAIRLYAGASSLTAYDNLTFEVPYAQMQEGVVYATYYSPSSTTRNTLIVAFGSNASLSTDSVEITINDMSVRFADKSVETLATESCSALSDLLNIADIEFTKGNCLKSDGSLLPNNNFMVSDYISVLQNKEVQYSIHGYNSVAVLCMYTSGKTKTGNAVVSNTEQILTGTLMIPADVAYIRVCRWSTSKNADDTITIPHIVDVAEKFNDIEQQISDIGIGAQWNGKIWHCFGTSVSNASNEGKYPPYLVALSGLQYVNFGYSGGKITQQILNQIKSDSSIANADLITVEGFVNDWSQQSPIGELTDTTADTFYGALYEAITYILSHSNATLVFITDTTGQNYNSIDLRRQAVRNGKTQNDFIEATIKMCNYMNIPVIDAGRKSCISQDTADLYLVDQIHHTEKGGEQYAKTIWAELKNIMPRIV